MRRFAAILALAAMFGGSQAAQAAAAAAPTCLTPREFTALSTYALPSVIDGTAKACSPVLGAQGYLPQHGGELAQRYSVGKDRAWPEAKAAFIKISTASSPESAQLFLAMPDDSLQQVVDAAMVGIVSGKIKPGSCGTIDRVVGLLAPLPAENTAELIAVLVGLGSKADQPRLGKFAICKA